MNKAGDFVEYLNSVKYGKDIILILRDIILSSGLRETIKWGQPVYTCNDKNVVGMGQVQ